MNNILEIKNLEVSFNTEDGEVEAVRNIELKLKRGETLAIVGESGCGKSVLCKTIMRILPKNGFIKKGKISLNNYNIVDKSQKEMNSIRGKEVSMIFQDPMTSLNPTISVGKQIQESVLVHNKISKLEAKKKAIELIELVGIDNAKSRYKQYPHHFSGGMRQRIVIAIALACNPKILIADEPTTALDVTIQSQIIELIKSLQDKTGISIIFITHDLGVVAEIADRVAVMYAGKIVEVGTAEDIFYNAKHPYTRGLLNSLPDIKNDVDFLYSIPGMPPDLINPPKGDAFACRNENALKIDYFEEPPMFKISEKHSAATWLLHEKAPEFNKSRFNKSEKRVSNE
ncbi:ABC transporter ATP-binding protein [Romboutsia lituseburensis]|uniref:ABC transporter ATP-binding protein n=1 Tax=Romboutsia lituseburensis TaxID=1537 RepID=UPI00215B1DCC|nr:ABC transporter ATP-binding protein [Romboutsia lituseburensis]MCR8746348.1 ABC transporter ATP-binding protein [Romboutsia lituseburensis]